MKLRLFLHCHYFCMFQFSLSSVKDPDLAKKVKSLSRVQLFATLLTIAYQAPPSTGSSRQEYWSGLPFSSSPDTPQDHCHRKTIWDWVLLILPQSAEEMDRKKKNHQKTQITLYENSSEKTPRPKKHVIFS